MPLCRLASLLIPVLGVVLVLLCLSAPLAAADTTIETGANTPAGETEAAVSDTPWWVWPTVLFVFCFVLGIVAVVAGIGGGVLYVPLVAGFFPFHIDFVRTTGLLMALSGALAAGPGLLKRRLASIRLALPCALFASMGALAGASVGLRMDAAHVQLALGACILSVVVLMAISKNVEFPDVRRPDRLGRWLGIEGSYQDQHLDQPHTWQVRRTTAGLALFVVVGFVAGMFGLGAGWASVPVLNLVMGVPLKIAVGSSVFMLSMTGATGAWVYLKSGGWLPILALPSVFGLMLGTSIGVKILGRTRPKSVRYVVIGVMVIAAVRSILKGSGVW